MFELPATDKKVLPIFFKKLREKFQRGSTRGRTKSINRFITEPPHKEHKKCLSLDSILEMASAKLQWLEKGVREQFLFIIFVIFHAFPACCVILCYVFMGGRTWEIINSRVYIYV